MKTITKFPKLIKRTRMGRSLVRVLAYPSAFANEHLWVCARTCKVKRTEKASLFNQFVCVCVCVCVCAYARACVRVCVCTRAYWALSIQRACVKVALARCSRVSEALAPCASVVTAQSGDFARQFRICRCSHSCPIAPSSDVSTGVTMSFKESTTVQQRWA